MKDRVLIIGNDSSIAMRFIIRAMEQTAPKIVYVTEEVARAPATEVELCRALDARRKIKAQNQKHFNRKKRR